MASNATPLRRRRSATDAYFFLRNPDAANAARSDLINMVEGMRQRSSQLDDFANALPKVTESDLAVLGQSDSTCPICLTSLLAILAEEETAIAMDSPAHPIEELGVTRLAQTCGHIFCRKDIRGWLYQGRTTCPTCRTPFITDTANADSGPEARAGAPVFRIPADADAASFDAFLDSEVTRAFEVFLQGPARPDGNQNATAAAEAGGDAPPRQDGQQHYEEAHFEYNDDRSDFSGMYS